MHPLDASVLAAYLAGTILLGVYFSRRQHTVSDYFVGGRQMPWWAVMGSIVATETSTVTFISVPGFAFGGDLTFLQLVFGYLVGRLVIAVLFVPAYFRRELVTVYQLLGHRFGGGVRRLISGVFLATRTVADGVRLFTTGLMLGALVAAIPAADAALRQWFPGADPAFAALAVSVVGLGLVTIAYTYLGGMVAVVWNDVLQLVVYLVGACAAAGVLLAMLPGGWPAVVEIGAGAGKFRVFDFTWDLGRSYTFWSGLIGGAFLTTATHGTDQLMVQRYLASRSPRDANLALIGSGVLVLAQFVLFLLLGVMLYAFYTTQGAGELAALTVDGRVQTDRVFPHFIVSHLPPGLVGLIVAAILAAAMSTLSSSLNSSSAASVVDFYIPWTRERRSDAHYLRLSRGLTLVWGALQIGVALAAIRLSRRAVDEVLGIAAFTSGIILGVFFLGTFTRRVGSRAAMAGIVAGAAVMLSLRLFTGVSWQWYVMTGSIATFAAGWLASYVMPDESSRGSGRSPE